MHVGELAHVLWIGIHASVVTMGLWTRQCCKSMHHFVVECNYWGALMVVAM